MNYIKIIRNLKKPSTNTLILYSPSHLWNSFASLEHPAGLLSDNFQTWPEPKDYKMKWTWMVVSFTVNSLVVKFFSILIIAFTKCNAILIQPVSRFYGMTVPCLPIWCPRSRSKLRHACMYAVTCIDSKVVCMICAVISTAHLWQKVTESASSGVNIL